MNLFSEFNATKPEQIGRSQYPWLAGWRGEIYQDNNRVWALVVHASPAGNQRQYLAIVPTRTAERADAILFDPYNDAAYSQSMFDLASNALAGAQQHQQTGQKKARTGGFNLAA